MGVEDLESVSGNVVPKGGERILVMRQHLGLHLATHQTPALRQALGPWELTILSVYFPAASPAGEMHK